MVDKNIRLVIVFQYAMNHVIEATEVVAGEIVGNVNLKGCQNQSRVVSLTLDSSSFTLRKVERIRK